MSSVALQTTPSGIRERGREREGGEGEGEGEGGGEDGGRCGKRVGVGRYVSMSGCVGLHWVMV